MYFVCQALKDSVQLMNWICIKLRRICPSRVYCWVERLWRRIFRSSHHRYSVKKGVLKNFANFTGKNLWWSLFNKVTGLQAYNFIKKRLPHRYFPVKSSKCLRTSILRTSANDCFWILLVKLLVWGQQLNQKITASGSFSWEFLWKFLIVSPEAYLEPNWKSTMELF